MTLTDAILEEVIEPFKDELAKYKLNRVKSTYLWWGLGKEPQSNTMYYVTLNDGLLWFGGNIGARSAGLYHYPRANQQGKVTWDFRDPNTSIENIHKVLRKHINKLGHLYGSG